MFATVRTDPSGKIIDNPEIVTDALAKIAGEKAYQLLDMPGKEFTDRESFDAQLHYAIRHGGALLVQRNLDHFGVELLGVRFHGAFMDVLTADELKKYGSEGVIYGDFEIYL